MDPLGGGSQRSLSRLSIDEQNNHEVFTQMNAQMDADNEAMEAYYLETAPRWNPVSHNDRVAVDKGIDQHEFIHQIAQLQSQDDRIPAMGAVHIVRPSANYADDHFMLKDVDGDINEGQKEIVKLQRHRNGPFRDRKGESTVMDSSRHVIYRNRSGTMEITISRGVTISEIRTLFSKLSAHRSSTRDTYVVLIRGSRRLRMGKLQDMDLHHLRRQIEESISQFGRCGIELVESGAGRGAMYGSHVHSTRFKMGARARKGAFGRRRRRDPEFSSDDEF